MIKKPRLLIGNNSNFDSDFFAKMQVTFGSLSTSLSGQRGHLLISFPLLLLN